ncbi:hypothetical protein BJ170DRAFT_595759 [Xylariales sp. AK1849]|nr:hypothetical protein BJ170DRAFT_595759 [Xylariales sp. AK1849]
MLTHLFMDLPSILGVSRGSEQGIDDARSSQVLEERAGRPENAPTVIGGCNNYNIASLNSAVGICGEHRSLIYTPPFPCPELRRVFSKTRGYYRNGGEDVRGAEAGTLATQQLEATINAGRLRQISQSGRENGTLPAICGHHRRGDCIDPAWHGTYLHSGNRLRKKEGGLAWLGVRLCIVPEDENGQTDRFSKHRASASGK